MKIVILAGGTGTRLWPLSRQATPKQFTAITSEQSLLRETVDRFAETYDLSKDIFISTGTQFVDAIVEALPEIPREHIIVEPSKRDTGPAMGFVAAYLSRIAPDEPMAFLPSDHLIRDTQLFLKSLSVAEETIQKTGKMLDVGLPPLFPSTALGYTGIGDQYENVDGIELFTFTGHKEKPDEKTARQLVEDGYLWHSSYYMWTPQKFLDAYQAYAPEMHATLMELRTMMEAGKSVDDMRPLYATLEKISIDYAVTEKMDPADVLIIKGTFGWSDVGTWNIVHEELPKDAQKNVVRGDVVALETTNSLIYGKKGKMIATIGCEDMVIVDTDDALLVMPKSHAQDMKKIIEKLEEDGREEYL